MSVPNSEIVGVSPPLPHMGMETSSFQNVVFSSF
jgi:hypothetical protein